MIMGGRNENSTYLHKKMEKGSVRTIDQVYLGMVVLEDGSSHRYGSNILVPYIAPHFTHLVLGSL